jgi:hypothetical protein
MCERVWGTCLYCGWVGLIDMGRCGCPDCGYGISIGGK